MIKIREYDLPDAELLNDNYAGPGVLVWVPDFFCIVLGQSNDPVASIVIDGVKKDNIPVYKRPSGGETVVLSANTLVISLVKKNEPLRSPKRYFSYFNGEIIHALSSLGVQDLAQRGISDICLGNKKILGSSIYRNKDTLFYHAVLNISEPVLNMEKYLKHPSREPGYREKRSHKDFVTSLTSRGYQLKAEDIKRVWERQKSTFLPAFS